jgi:ACR3 family arsenite transporter
MLSPREVDLLFQELEMTVANSVYGVNSQQALAATIRPLTKVPVLRGLSWVALYDSTILSRS